MTPDVIAQSPAEAWVKASRAILSEGTNYGDIIEILNGVVVIKQFLDDKEFDTKFREIFGDERIDYASSVTFVKPEESIVDGSLMYTDIKPSWKDSYWGRMIRYDNCFNQVEEVVKILKQGKNVKRCELVVYSPYDIKNMYKQPCLLAIDIKPRNGKLYLSATFRSQRVSKSGYADYTALVNLGKWLAEQSNTVLEHITCVAHSWHIMASGDENKKTKELLASGKWW
jgi:thymidylate synthase